MLLIRIYQYFYHNARPNYFGRIFRRFLQGWCCCYCCWVWCHLGCHDIRKERKWVHTFHMTREQKRGERWEIPCTTPSSQNNRLNQLCMKKDVLVVVSPHQKQQNGGETALQHRKRIFSTFCWLDVFETNQKHRATTLLNKNRGPTFLNMIFSLVAKRGENVFLMGKLVVIKGPTNVELDVFLVSPTLY